MRVPLGMIRRGLPLAAAVAVPLVVAAAVLLIVTRRGGDSGPHSPVATAHVAQSAARRGLIASLEVLRTSTYFISAETEAIWRRVDGRVIRRVRTSLQLPVRVQHTGRGTGCIAGPDLNYDGCDGPPKAVR